MRPKKVKVADKEVTLTLDLNAIIAFCENYEIDFTEWESALNHPAKIRYFIWCMAKSGGSDVSEEEIGKLALSDMTEVLDGIGEKEEKKGSAKK